MISEKLLSAPVQLPWMLACGLVACNSGDTPPVAPETPEGAGAAPNILVIVADDAGAPSSLPVSISAPRRLRLPHLDALAARGMQFSNVWAQPMCSPTRATLLAGRYAFRTGVGFATAGAGVGGDYPAAPNGLPVRCPNCRKICAGFREHFSMRIRPVDTAGVELRAPGARRSRVCRRCCAIRRAMATAGNRKVAFGRYQERLARTSG